jgi:hypothetical protein
MFLADILVIGTVSFILIAGKRQLRASGVPRPEKPLNTAPVKAHFACGRAKNISRADKLYLIHVFFYQTENIGGLSRGTGGGFEKTGAGGAAKWSARPCGTGPEAATLKPRSKWMTALPAAHMSPAA